MNLDSEIILQRKISPIVYAYIMIIIVITLSLIILTFLLNYKTYYKMKGTVVEEDNHYYINLYLPLSDYKYLVNSNIVTIDKKDYNYKILSVDKEYYTDNNTTYQIIKIELPLEDKYKINNLVIDLQIQKENKRVINYIIKK